MQSTVHSKVHYEILPNGLTLLLREARLAPVADIQIFAKVGSADERPGEGGLAHFHEHMLFKGTSRRGLGDVAGEVEGAGGRINAYTTFDVTVYYATMPADSLTTGLDVLADAVQNSLFDEDEVRREREVVLEEIRRAEDTPGHVLGDAVFGTVYRQHPYREPILGPAENVGRFERAQVRSFFERWYTSDNLVVVAAGDFDAREFAGQVALAFRDAKPGSARRKRHAEPKQSGLRSHVLLRPFEGARVDLAWRATKFADADTPLLDLLSFILGECDSSRLVQGVRDRDQLVERIDTSSYTPLDPGVFSVNFEAEPRQVREAIERVVAETERLRTERVSGSELERARANFLASEHFERESVSGIAGRLGSFEVLAGNYEGDAIYLEKIRTATPDDLLRVARAHLAPERLSVVAMLPESEAAHADDGDLRAAVERGVERTQRKFAPPTRVGAKGARAKSAGATSTRARSKRGKGKAKKSEIESYRLANGAALYVLPRRDVPVVAARAAGMGGLLAETDETAGLTSFLSSMWTRGTRSRSAADFSRAVEDIAAEVSGFSGRSSQGFTIESIREKFEPALDLFAEALLDPGFDDEEIERERRETLASIDRRADRLAQLAYIQFGEVHFPTHPYRLPMLGYESTVKRIDAAALRAHHERLMRAGNLVIGVAGDVDPDTVAEAFSVRLGDLSTLPFEPPCPALDAPPLEVQHVTLKKDRAQAHLVIGFRGFTVADPDRPALDVLSQVLAGQGGRLFLELRDKQSLAYSVSATSVEGLAPGYFSVYIATANDKLEEAQKGILAELSKIVDSAPSEAELSRARRYLAGSLAIDAQRNGNHASHIALDALYGLGPEAHEEYAERIAAITAEDVLRVARRVLTLDAYTLSIVGG